MLRLIVHEGQPRGQAYPIKDGTTLGRLATCDVPLQDIHASRRNARIERGADGFYIEDLGSTCGTLVNGQKVKKVRLAPGDLIMIGNTVLRLEDDAAPVAAAPAPAVVAAVATPPGPAPAGPASSGRRRGASHPPAPAPALAPVPDAAADVDTRMRRRPQDLPSVAAKALFVLLLVAVVLAARWVGARVHAKVSQPAGAPAGR